MASASSSHNNFAAIVAGVAAIAGLLFGYDTGVISGALLFIRPQFQLDAQSEGLIVSSVLFGATISALLSGKLTDHFGRKLVLIFTAITFAIGSFASAFSQNIPELALSRLILGLAIGVASYCAPLYIGEIAPPEKRGQLVGLNQLAITIGILLSYVVDYIFSEKGEWQYMVGLGAIPALILGVAVLTLPESPRWLMLHHRDAEAESVLKRVRGTSDVSDELGEIKSALSQEEGTWSDLLKPDLRPALIVGIGLGLFQQFTGINTVVYYSPTIFQLAGFQSNSVSILATAGVGLVNVLMTVVGLFLVDRLGRRPLLMTGIAGMGVALLALSLSFQFQLTQAQHQVIGVGSLMLYVASFAISLGPIFWLMISEIYPLRVRGLAMSFATSMQWLCNVIVSFSFPILLKSVGTPPTFAIYAAICVLALLFSFKFVPETKGLSLEAIERHEEAASH